MENFVLEQVKLNYPIWTSGTTIDTGNIMELLQEIYESAKCIDITYLHLVLPEDEFEALKLHIFKQMVASTVNVSFDLGATEFTNFFGYNKISKDKERLLPILKTK